MFGDPWELVTVISTWPLVVLSMGFSLFTKSMLVKGQTASLIWNFSVG